MYLYFPDRSRNKQHTNSQTQHIFLTMATCLGFNRQAIIMGTTHIKGTFRLSETKAEAVTGLWGAELT